MSDFLKTEKARARILGFLALIDDISGETPAGLRQDENQRKELEAELQALECGLNALAGLSRAGNALNRLIATVKRP